MIKTLVQHGNSSALIIEKPIMDLLNITPDTPLEIITDGKSLIISPVQDENRMKKLDSSLEKVNAKHHGTLQKLAQ